MGYAQDPACRAAKRAQQSQHDFLPYSSDDVSLCLRYLMLVPRLESGSVEREG